VSEGRTDLVRDPAPPSGFDVRLALALPGVPAAVAALFTWLLAGSWSWALFGPLFVLLFIGLRPAIWAVAASGSPVGAPRRVLYLERRDHTANTALVVMAIAGLAIMDVFRLPGSPYWTNQPIAGSVLVAVAMYLVWVSTYSSIPTELRQGWVGLLKGKGGR
jgi:hypothetical protein